MRIGLIWFFIFIFLAATFTLVNPLENNETESLQEKIDSSRKAKG
jgi:hypothetical protein